MALSVFDDKAHPPTDEDVAAALGKAHPRWQELKARIEGRFAPVTVEWGFPTKSSGWGLRLSTPKRTILYMTPRKGNFLASLSLGEKAVAAAVAAGLPAPVLAVIEAAPKYAEGRGVRIEVRTPDDVRQVEKLAVIKMGH
jgi:hypothetical protein